MFTSVISSDLSVLGNILASADSPWLFFGQIGPVLALGMAAAGSAIGIGKAGQASAGAWSREAKTGKSLNFTYIVLLGMPISQVLYAMIVMNKMAGVIQSSEFTIGHSGLFLGIGLGTGLGEMFSAWMQGLTAAAGIRALSEGDGKGFAFLIIAMGIVETVGIFTMVFMLGMIPAV